MSIPNKTTRRTFTATGAATALALATGHRTAFGQTASPESEPASALPAELPNGGIQADGTWAFTDDLGFTLTAASAPTRVISHIGMAAALYDFGFEVIGYYNPATDADGNPLPIAGDLPLDRVTHVGDHDEVDIELIISLNADMLIGQNYDVAAGTMWPFPDDVLAQIKQAVPVLSFAYGDGADVVRNIQSIENLAAALGADVSLPEITADRDTFVAASADLEGALAAKPDLSVLFMSGSNTGFWVDSAGGAATRYYANLGMTLLQASDMAEQSWEQFVSFEADLIFLDDRSPNWWQPEELAAEVPVWEHHPAVAADQVGPWRAQFISSYRGFAPVITEVVEWVEKAELLS